MKHRLSRCCYGYSLPSMRFYPSLWILILKEIVHKWKSCHHLLVSSSSCSKTSL